ncbi:amino acid deaminase [Aliidongia dinghuensis]|uniref:Amino acid deaminase n=1 Tax=Aliidongia dinghuensis TaxID=1867774 RepID=A0A8J3E7A7_9PROT|nr:alanine racemase [Aliidongia dinghuensis]GGF50355.1 amino acid deaminase [Aliidongia dinghuensis]
MHAFIADTLDGPLDDTVRGVPPGTTPMKLRDVAYCGWHPARGEMSLPVLTLDEAAFTANRELLLAYVRSHGAALAPHAKTPMAPQLTADLISAGVWGITVANLQQATVMLRAGIKRLLLANEIGGIASGRRLGALLAAYPDVDVRIFADSPEAVATLAVAATEANRSALPVLVEVGIGRGGARDAATVEQIIAAVQAADGRLALGGIATYEGAAASADPIATRQAIEALMTRALDAFARVRERVPTAPLLFSAGGSAFFDLVVGAASAPIAADGNATLLLRSGALFFHDHGTYDRALRAMDERQGFVVNGIVRSAATSFRPALRLWGEVLSRPEPGLAILGFGMRDVSFDQDLPRPLAAYRDGAPVDGFDPDHARVAKLNDQHAFLAVSDNSPLAVGDVLEFGISHPCTCLDRWRVLFGLDPDGRVRTAYRTFFG